MTRSIKVWFVAVVASLTVASALPLHARTGTTTPRAASVPPAQAPANLTATVGDARVSLAWQAVDGATGYRIFRGAAGVWDPAPIASTSRTTFTNSGLANGIAYAYRVAAYTKGGVGPMSNAASATPMAPRAG